MIKKYKCKECGKEVEILKLHIKNQHKDLTIDQYFIKYASEKEVYDLYMQESKIQRQKRSPNSIHFYIEKGFTPEEAQIELDKYNLNNPWHRLDVSPSQPKYWMKKGYSEEEALKKSKFACSHSLESLTIKYGAEIGQQKYDRIQNSFKTRKDTIIKRLGNKFSCNIDEATKLYNERMRLISPKTLDYWLNKGYTVDEAKDIMKERGQNTSPRHINYWMTKCGNDQKLAKKCHYEYQDNCSVAAIMKKYNCSEEDAVNRHNAFINKMLNTLERKGCIFKRTKTEFGKYSAKVRSMTEKNYKQFKHIIDPDNLRSKEFHLDHKYSLLQGFLDGIEESIIASVFNLRIISHIENHSKYTKCSITKEQLIKTINNINIEEYEN